MTFAALKQSASAHLQLLIDEQASLHRIVYLPFDPEQLRPFLLNPVGTVGGHGGLPGQLTSTPHRPPGDAPSLAPSRLFAPGSAGGGPSDLNKMNNTQPPVGVENISLSEISTIKPPVNPSSGAAGGAVVNTTMAGNTLTNGSITISNGISNTILKSEPLDQILSLHNSLTVAGASQPAPPSAAGESVKAENNGAGPLDDTEPDQGGNISASSDAVVHLNHQHTQTPGSAHGEADNSTAAVLDVSCDSWSVASEDAEGTVRQTGRAGPASEPLMGAGTKRRRKTAFELLQESFSGNSRNSTLTKTRSGRLY